MKLLIILSAVCYLFLFTHSSFAQKTAIQYYEEGKSYEQKAKFTKAFIFFEVQARVAFKRLDAFAFSGTEKLAGKVPLQ